MSSYPNKEQRTKCYTARDGLWTCLDTNQDNKDKCIDWRKQFESLCPQQWVTHFDRKRDYLKYKDKIENEGFEPIDQKDNKTNK